MDVSSPSSEGNVCIVCDDTDEYLVFVVNLKWKVGCKSDGIVTSTKVKPTVRLDCGNLDEPAVCVVGSTLYWFDWNVTPGDSKSMYTFQLPRDASNLKLNKGMMTEGPSMKSSKTDPGATPTPCGKILVFSSRIANDYDSSDCDFELYDPATGIWRKLPVILPLIERREVFHMYHFRIKSFTFMGKDVFVINTEVGVFNLDIKKRGATWKRGGFCGLGCPCAQSPSPFVLIGKELCLTHWQAHDIHDVSSSSFYTFPELSKSSRGYTSMPSGGVLLLEENSENFSVCVVQFAVKEETEEETEVAELLLQVYSCRNRTECMAKLSDYRLKNAEEPPKEPWERTSVELPATTKASSSRYVLEDTSLWLHSFSSIPPAPALSRKRKFARLNPSLYLRSFFSIPRALAFSRKRKFARLNPARQR